MLLATVKSVNNASIRLTKERWEHIKNSHPEIAHEDLENVLNAVSKPDVILKGDLDELLAVKREAGGKLWFVVPYKEIDSNDGFILTAYVTTDAGWLFKKKVIWSKD